MDRENEKSLTRVIGVLKIKCFEKTQVNGRDMRKNNSGYGEIKTVT